MSIQFVWKDEYSTGDSLLDEQHKRLFEMGSRVGEQPPEEMNDFRLKLYRYVVDHFDTEEAYMETIGFPDFDRHKGLHDNLVRELKRFPDQFTMETAMEFKGFFYTWLFHHVLHEDRQYFAWARTKEGCLKNDG